MSENKTSPGGITKEDIIDSDEEECNFVIKKPIIKRQIQVSIPSTSKIRRISPDILSNKNYESPNLPVMFQRAYGNVFNLDGVENNAVAVNDYLEHQNLKLKFLNLVEELENSESPSETLQTTISSNYDLNDTANASNPLDLDNTLFMDISIDTDCSDSTLSMSPNADTISSQSLTENVAVSSEEFNTTNVGSETAFLEDSKVDPMEELLVSLFSDILPSQSDTSFDQSYQMSPKSSDKSNKKNAKQSAISDRLLNLPSTSETSPKVYAEPLSLLIMPTKLSTDSTGPSLTWPSPETLPETSNTLAEIPLNVANSPELFDSSQLESNTLLQLAGTSELCELLADKINFSPAQSKYLADTTNSTLISDTSRITPAMSRSNCDTNKESLRINVELFEVDTTIPQVHKINSESSKMSVETSESSKRSVNNPESSKNCVKNTESPKNSVKSSKIFVKKCESSKESVENSESSKNCVKSSKSCKISAKKSSKVPTTHSKSSEITKQLSEVPEQTTVPPDDLSNQIDRGDGKILPVNVFSIFTKCTKMPNTAASYAMNGVPFKFVSFKGHVINRSNYDKLTTFFVDDASAVIKCKIEDFPWISSDRREFATLSAEMEKQKEFLAKSEDDEMDKFSQLLVEKTKRIYQEYPENNDIIFGDELLIVGKVYDTPTERIIYAKYIQRENNIIFRMHRGFERGQFEAKKLYQ